MISTGETFCTVNAVQGKTYIKYFGNCNHKMVQQPAKGSQTSPKTTSILLRKQSETSVEIAVDACFRI